MRKLQIKKAYYRKRLAVKIQCGTNIRTKSNYRITIDFASNLIIQNSFIAYIMYHVRSIPLSATFIATINPNTETGYYWLLI